MKKSNLISLVLALIVGLWMGIGIMNVGAGVVMFVAVFLVVKLFCWGLAVDLPGVVALRVNISAKDEASPGIEKVRGKLDVAFEDREELEEYMGEDDPEVKARVKKVSGTLYETVERGRTTFADLAEAWKPDPTFTVSPQMYVKYNDMAAGRTNPLLTIPPDAGREELEQVRRRFHFARTPEPGDVMEVTTEGIVLRERET